MTAAHHTDPGSSDKGAGHRPEGMRAVRGSEHPPEPLLVGFEGSYCEPASVSETARRVWSMWTSVRQSPVIYRIVAAFFKICFSLPRLK